MSLINKEIRCKKCRRLFGVAVETDGTIALEIVCHRCGDKRIYKISKGENSNGKKSVSH